MLEGAGAKAAAGRSRKAHKSKNEICHVLSPAAHHTRPRTAPTCQHSSFASQQLHRQGSSIPEDRSLPCRLSSQKQLGRPHRCLDRRWPAWRSSRRSRRQQPHCTAQARTAHRKTGSSVSQTASPEGTGWETGWSARLRWIVRTDYRRRHWAAQTLNWHLYQARLAPSGTRIRQPVGLPTGCRRGTK